MKSTASKPGLNTRWRNNKRLITQNLKRSKHKSVVARRDISQEILVARHKCLVAPGRRAGDFASTEHFRKVIAFPFLKLELCRYCLFRAGSFSGLSSRIQVLAHMPCCRHFTLKPLRLPVLNETHTNSYTGPRLDTILGHFPLHTHVTIVIHLTGHTLNY
jgi:hypothetical protein